MVSLILSVSFNQDSTCVALSTQQGILVYNLESHEVCYRHDVGAIAITEMLFCSSVMAYVGAGEQPALTPRRLLVMNTASSSVVQDMSFPTSVLAVKMNHTRLVAVTERRTCVYAMHDLSLLRTIEADNPKASTHGCAALTSCPGLSLLALPTSGSRGSLRVYDLSQDASNVLCEVQAHQQPVVVAAWNHDATLFATASSKGTVIRVHRLPHAAKAFTFRRGTTSATVTSIAFSPPGTCSPPLLCACSDHGSVHVFRLAEMPEPKHPAAALAASAAAGLLSAVTRVSIADMVEPSRNIATLRLPRTHIPAICTMRPRDVPAASTDALASTSSQGPQQLGNMHGSQLAGSGGGADSLSSSYYGSAAGAAAGGGGGGGGGLSGTWDVAGPGSSGGSVVVVVASTGGMLYEYALEDLANPAGPKCTLEGEWNMMGSNPMQG